MLQEALFDATMIELNETAYGLSDEVENPAY